MNKGELILRLAEECNFTPEKSAAVVDIFFESMKNALFDNERIEIRGLGSFKIKTYNEYTGRNPKSGESVPVPAKRMPYFRASKDLKDFVNN